MTERPILFSGAMVRAILQGRKQQTRRALRIQPPPGVTAEYDRPTGGAMWGSIHGDHGTHCPYGKPGDRLWVRETHAGDNLCGWVYRADHPDADISAGELDDGEQSLRRWTPGIHMKREACRLALEVTGVRVERLHAITWQDAFAEGFEPQPALSADPIVHRDAARDWYMDLWDSLNAKRGLGWAANPWVWVVEFRRT